LKKKSLISKFKAMVMAEVLTAMLLFSLASFGLLLALNTLVSSQHQTSRNRAWEAVRNWSAQTRYEQVYVNESISRDGLEMVREVNDYVLPHTLQVTYKGYTPDGYLLVEWIDIVNNE